MVMVKYSETYDLSTTKDKIGLIGIRSPTTGAITRLYDGLWKNFRYARVVKCDITLACASILPADPLQIGIEEGDIAPQDMFNPILYKAVSNESMNGIVDRLYAQSSAGAGVEPAAPVTVVDNDPLWSSNGSDDFNIYYGQLAAKGWKKAMPQQGLAMRNLRPFVYPVQTTGGNLAPNPTAPNLIAAQYPSNAISGQTARNATALAFLRGRAQAMGRLPTHYTPTGGVAPSDYPLPNVWVAAILTPPARQHVLYYRMRVVWTIEFTRIMSNLDYNLYGTLSEISNYLYGTDEYSSKIAAEDVPEDSKVTETDSVVTVDVGAARVM